MHLVRSGVKKTSIVDTNVLLRYLVGDDHQQQLRAKEWFKQAERGKKNLVLKPVVVAEACFVLESFYKNKRSEISEALSVLLAQKWLIVEDRVELLQLWPWYKQGLHFVDAFLLASAKEQNASILTFDLQLSKKS